MIRILPFLVVVLIGLCATADDGVFIPAPFAEIEGDLIQEFTVIDAQRVSEGNVLFRDPVDACVIQVNDTIDISLFIDDVWNKIVCVTAIIDEDGLRRRAWFRDYAGPFIRPSGITYDPDFRVEMTGLGLSYVWPVFVADAGCDRVVELDLHLPTSLQHLPWLMRRRHIGEGHLSQPSDVSFCDSWGYLYIVHRGMRPVVAYDTRLCHGIDPVLAVEFGWRGDGICEFSNPVSIHCDADAGAWPQYVYVCDPENQRVVCLNRGDPYEASIGWLSYYSEPFFEPTSVSSYQGCGVYVLNRGVNGPELAVLDPVLTHKLGTYADDSLLHPRSVHVRAGEAGIINEYNQSAGIAYYLLDSKIENAVVSPDPFDPLETHTLISYTLSGYGDLTARVYDASWNLRRTLVDSVLTSAGPHWEWWDGRDDSQMILPSGFYHVLLSVWDYGGDGNPDRDTIDVTIAGVPVRILTAGLWVWHPSWSNSGSKIAFASAEFSDPENGIWVVDYDGSNLTRVTEPGPTQYDNHPDWSPSDSFLVFQRAITYTFNTTGFHLDYLNSSDSSCMSLDIGESRIYRIRPDGTGLTPLTVPGEKWDWNPSWSPFLTNEGGSIPPYSGKIAFWRYADNQLWTFKAVDGSGRTMVTAGEDSIGIDPLPNKGYPAWSPDGRQIAFQTRPADSVGLWKIDIETGSYALLSREPAWGDVSGVSWSPDGDRVAYEIADSDTLQTGIKAVSARGMFEASYIVRNQYGYGLDWSPDGTKVAFAVMRGDTQSLAIADFKRDNSAFPAVNVISPVSGQVVTDTVEIWGTAHDNVSVDGESVLSEMDSYAIEWGRGLVPLTWSADRIMLTGGKIENGILGTWNTNGLDEDVYTLRVSATDGVDTNVDGIWVRVCGPTSALARGSDVPTGFETSGPCPNPFGGATSLRVGVPYRSRVTVAIYDCQGRLVRRLNDSSLEAGYHRVQWDGRDAEGRTCASGVYWCVVNTGTLSRSAKVVLLR